MLRSVQDLFRLAVGATDGEIGTAYNLLFHDQWWMVRYLVVESGSWLNRKRVLLAPAALGTPDWGRRVAPVSLSREQVRSSPDVDTDRPVSRQQEMLMNRYYGWPDYWKEGSEAGEEEARDPHLRSAREVMGYEMRARDGEVGSVEDFLLDDETWVLRYLVVDTGHWLPGRRILVAPPWIERVSWAQRSVIANLEKERIEKSPAYDPPVEVSREYEATLYDYYGQGKYWE